MWFRCTVRGENFPGELLGSPGELGFYVTRFVDAPDAAQAEAHVLAALKRDPRLARPPGSAPSGRAIVYFDQITECRAADVPAQEPGFVFFPMDADSPP